MGTPNILFEAYQLSVPALGGISAVITHKKNHTSISIIRLKIETSSIRQGVSSVPSISFSHICSQGLPTPYLESWLPLRLRCLRPPSSLRLLFSEFFACSFPPHPPNKAPPSVPKPGMIASPSKAPPPAPRKLSLARCESLLLRLLLPLPERERESEYEW